MTMIEQPHPSGFADKPGCGTNTFEDVKVGDFVAVWPPAGWRTEKPSHIVEVKKVTKTQIKTECSVFDRKTGRQISSSGPYMRDKISRSSRAERDKFWEENAESTRKALERYAEEERIQNAAPYKLASEVISREGGKHEHLQGLGEHQLRVILKLMAAKLDDATLQEISSRL